MDGWIDGWIDGSMDGWMDARKDFIYLFTLNIKIVHDKSLKTV